MAAYAGSLGGLGADKFGGVGMHDNDRLADVSMAFPDPSGANAYSKGQQGASRGYGYSGYDVSANLGRQHMETSQGFGLGMDAAGRARAAQQSVNISAELPRRNETSFEPYATGVPGVNSGQEGANGAANSKAVLAALRSLQEKIRALEEDRGSLQVRLTASERNGTPVLWTSSSSWFTLSYSLTR
eukprot:1566665-Rhodomonas_salina.2